MIKLSASVSRKVPVPNLEFSSQSFHGGVEVEVSDGASEQQIRERLGALYALLDGAVQSEIAKAEARAAQPPQQPSPSQPRCNGNNQAQAQPKANGTGQPQPKANPNGSGRATQAQIKAIFAISKSIGMSRDDLLARVAKEFGVPNPDALSIGQASTLIQALKGANGQK
jgi:hypothetical protein